MNAKQTTEDIDVEGKTTRAGKRKTQRKPPTDHQARVLRFLKEEIRRTGTTPSRRLLGAKLGLRGTSTILVHLKGLERRGFLKVLSAGRGQRQRLRLTPPDAPPLLRATGRIDANEPLDAPERVMDQVAGTITDRFTPRPTCFTTVNRQAKSALGLTDNDLIAVRRTCDAQPGDVVVARVNSRLRYGRLTHSATGRATLVLAAASSSEGSTSVECSQRAFRLEGIVVGTLIARSFGTPGTRPRMHGPDRGTGALESAEMRGWNKQPLTRLQERVLNVVRESFAKTGLPPSHHQIQTALRTACAAHLVSLERHGWIVRTPRKHRSLRLADTREVPLIETPAAIACTEPILTTERVTDRIAETIADKFTPRPDYLLRVQGQRMSPAALNDAEWLAVRATTDAHDGDTVVGRIGTRVTIGRVRTTHTGQIHLMAMGTRPNREPDAGQVQIDGVIVGTLTARSLEGPSTRARA